MKVSATTQRRRKVDVTVPFYRLVVIDGDHHADTEVFYRVDNVGEELRSCSVTVRQLVLGRPTREVEVTVTMPFTLDGEDMSFLQGTGDYKVITKDQFDDAVAQAKRIIGELA
jgi:hypothetical protein